MFGNTIKLKMMHDEIRVENLESELSKLGLFSRQKRNEIEESLRQKRAYKNQLVDEKNKWI